MRRQYHALHHPGRALGQLRRSCTGTFSFICNGLFLTLLWSVLRLEHPRFIQLLRRRRSYFPQVNFNALRPLDPLRMTLQLLFLLTCTPAGRSERHYSLNDRIYAAIKRRGGQLRLQAGLLRRGLKTVLTAYHSFLADLGQAQKGPRSMRSAVLVLILSTAAAAMALWCITQPLALIYQLIFALLMLELALLLMRMHTNFSLLCLMVISFIISARYMFWRAGSTLNLEHAGDALCPLILFAAECYTFVIMILGYVQLSAPLERKPVPITLKPADFPSVDIFIPTYDEPLYVVKPTVLGALNLDWPADKLNVYILDDGTREEFRDFAAAAHCGYIVRREHNHAKAGNINHAMTKTHGDFIAIFDCDHVPVRAFLQITLGIMINDTNTALVQTPHHFYSQDPFERNLDIHTLPSENGLFHDFIQKGNDLWNAVMFCGSCAVMRRSALERIGGIAVDTVTEDAHTSLKLARLGYNSAFIGMPLTAGLSTETLSAHIAQRIRWARGMIQIFRLENPLSGRGLTPAQRICYLNAMLHFLHGIPRLIFILAPLPYLICGIYVIYAPALAILAYVIPHMAHSFITSTECQKGYRLPFWSVIYETVLSWYITLPTLLALLNPRLGKFNVTAKGGIIERDFFDWGLSKPYLLLIGLCFAGLFCGLYRLFFSPQGETFSILLNLFWLGYNLLILGSTAALLEEKKQLRRYPRIARRLPVMIEYDANLRLQLTTTDFSQSGLGIELDDNAFLLLKQHLQFGRRLKVYMPFGSEYYAFTGLITLLMPKRLGLELHFADLEEEKRFNLCTFARADLWSSDAATPQTNFNNFVSVIKIASTGYHQLLQFAPRPLRLTLAGCVALLDFIFSLLPRRPAAPAVFSAEKKA